MLYKFSFRCGEYVVAAGGGILMHGPDMALRACWQLASVYPVQEGADYDRLYVSL